MNVLIVDSDNAFRSNLALQLSKIGIASLDTGDLDEARCLACGKKMKALLLGLSSREQTWLAFIPEIRDLCPNAQVVLINHSGDVHLSMDAMKYGALTEIATPVNIGELKDVLTTTLRMGNES
ncbi:MAG: hypothetical protein ACNI3A_00615 [Desulfovibrio sp.]|uniref:hypothetical protein n=1 Tax=Desulfovibrio sp. 7SRBS1 TaxID=3378064 RepID=UPI003B3C3320